MYFHQNTNYHKVWFTILYYTINLISNNPMVVIMPKRRRTARDPRPQVLSPAIQTPHHQRGLLQTPQTRNISKFLEQPAICFQDIHTETSSSSSRNLSNKEAEKNQLYLLRHQSKMPESKREKHKINSTEENSENPMQKWHILIFFQNFYDILTFCFKTLL